VKKWQFSVAAQVSWHWPTMMSCPRPTMFISSSSQLDPRWKPPQSDPGVVGGVGVVVVVVVGAGVVVVGAGVVVWVVGEGVVVVVVIVGGVVGAAGQGQESKSGY